MVATSKTDTAASVVTEKDLEDERDRLKDENKSKQEMLDTKDLEIKTLREALDQIKAENNKNSGALRETRNREKEEQRKRMELEEAFQKLTNEYDILCCMCTPMSRRRYWNMHR